MPSAPPSPAPLTIGLVLDDSLDRPDGVQQHVLTLGAWLSAEGHQVHYLATSTRRQDLENVHDLAPSWSVRFNGNRLSTPRPAAPARLRALLAAGQFDVLNVAMPYSPFMSGRLLSRVGAATAVVGTFHIVPNSRWVDVGARLLGLLQRPRLRRFDRVVAVSEPAAQFARTAFGIDAGVVSNPVDVGRFARAGTAAAPYRDADPVRIVFLGRLVERKGAAELLRAVEVVHREDLCHGPFRVVIAGRGPLAADLEGFAADHGIRHLVDFAGFVAEDDKPALLASGDIVALPSTGGEGFGISVVEALAAARGVVLVGDNSGYRTVMGSLTDQLVDAGDPRAFAQVLARYIDDADLRRQAPIRQRAQAWHFDVATVGPQMVDTYRAAIASRARLVAATPPS